MMSLLQYVLVNYCRMTNPISISKLCSETLLPWKAVWSSTSRAKTAMLGIRVSRKSHLSKISDEAKSMTNECGTILLVCR